MRALTRLCGSLSVLVRLRYTAHWRIFSAYLKNPYRSTVCMLSIRTLNHDFCAELVSGLDGLLTRSSDARSKIEKQDIAYPYSIQRYTINLGGPMYTILGNIKQLILELVVVSSRRMGDRKSGELASKFRSQQYCLLPPSSFKQKSLS
jgi:hypothetical protein